MPRVVKHFDKPFLISWPNRLRPCRDAIETNPQRRSCSIGEKPKLFEQFLLQEEARRGYARRRAGAVSAPLLQVEPLTLRSGRGDARSTCVEDVGEIWTILNMISFPGARGKVHVHAAKIAMRMRRPWAGRASMPSARFTRTAPAPRSQPAAASAVAPGRTARNHSARQLDRSNRKNPYAQQGTSFYPRRSVPRHRQVACDVLKQTRKIFWKHVPSPRDVLVGSDDCEIRHVTARQAVILRRNRLERHAKQLRLVHGRSKLTRGLARSVASKVKARAEFVVYNDLPSASQRCGATHPG